MNNNRGSRKGIGVARTDFDVITSAFLACGVQFGTDVSRLHGPDAAEYGFHPLTKFQRVSFETTTLLFDRKGKYLGREYMARDECDYFRARAKEP